MAQLTTEFLNVAQAAAELNLTVRAVQHRIKTGTLEATKLGAGKTSAYVITRHELERVKRDMKAAPAAS